MDPDRALAARLFATSSLVLMLVGASACSTLRRPPPTIDRSNDAQVLADVQRRLEAEPSIDAREIRVEVDGGVVLLYGSVNGIGEWECAIRNAQLVPDVVTVVDYLTIQRGPRAVDCMAPRPET